jgi:hypothetical protein
MLAFRRCVSARLSKTRFAGVSGLSMRLISTTGVSCDPALFGQAGKQQTKWSMQDILNNATRSVPRGAIAVMFNRFYTAQKDNLSFAMGLRGARAPPVAMNYPMDLYNFDNCGNEELFGDDSALLLSSTMKKRAMKMNKHKLKKRRKALRMNTKRSRG